MHALGGARKAPGLRDRKTNLRTRSRDSPIYENEQIDDAKRAPKHLEVESQIGIPSSFDLVINVAITTVTSFGGRHAGSALHLISSFVNAVAQTAAFSAQARRRSAARRL